MEWLNIISKEPITSSSDILTIIIGSICILIVLGLLVYMWKSKNDKRVIQLLTIIASVEFLLILSCVVISNIFFREPTGEYKYSATIDKTKITVAEYEEFIEEYNPEIVDGIYYWQR